MTRAAWFKPVIATVLAIALGVGAAVVAMRFAPPTVVEAEAPTVEAIVLEGNEPLATVTATEEEPADPEPSDEPVDEAAAEDTPAPTVVIPDPAGLPADPPSAPVIPEPLAEALAETAASDDPFSIAEVLALGSTLPWLGGFTFDPCVLTPDAEECPAGSTGVVLDDDLPPLTARIQPAPARRRPPARTSRSMSRRTRPRRASG